jgi:hypothetical protein
MHLVVAVLFVTAMAAVNCQDPTTICYPAVFTNSYFNMMSEDKGSIYADFTKERYAEVSSVTGNRFLHDFTNLMSYAITGEVNHTTCHSFKLRESQIMYRCLPPYAKFVPDASGLFDYSTKMPVQTWDIHTEYDTVFRIVFAAATTPRVPLLSQQYGYHGTTQLFLYTNHATTISDPSVLEIPDSCSLRDLATIVG